MEKTRKFISYIRVSTEQQGNSGLGLEAQRRTIENYIKTQSYDHPTELLQEYQEIETGTNKHQRVQIHHAIAHAKKEKATLVVAKLDRLARDTAFVLSVMETGIDIIFCDFPAGNKFMITILAAIAEYEAKLISDRTRSALKEKQLKGIKLGNPQMRDVVQKMGCIASAHVRRENAKNNPLMGMVEGILKSHTYEETAEILNKSGQKSPTGKPFNKRNLQRLVTRYRGYYTDQPANS